MAPASARARRVSGCLAGIGSEEQIAKGTAQQVCDAAPGEMVRPVVNEMATLTQASQILQPIVSGIMVEVGSRQNNPGMPYASSVFSIGRMSQAAAMSTPERRCIGGPE
jgi:hypothetical protein